MKPPPPTSQQGHQSQQSWAATTIVLDHTATRKPAIIKIADGIYCAHDYAVANVFLIVTDTSVVVIDSTESLSAARAILNDFRKISSLPVSYLIYTHHHGDHTRGAKEFCSSETKVLAHRLLPQEIARKNLFLPHRERINSQQYATVLRFAKDGYIAPTTTFEHHYTFNEGGISFDLSHAPGETEDHVRIWLPQQKVLFPGDLFYGCFPMLNNPLKPARPVSAWTESLDHMLTLQSEHLAPSHGLPMHGAAVIAETLAKYARAIRHIHDATVRCINAGQSLDATLRKVRLPPELASLPYLREKYGKVAWTVRGLFRQYTGWYDFNPSGLKANPEPLRQRVLLEVCGVSPLVERAQRALREDEPQLVLELANVILAGWPGHLRARRLRLSALQRLAAASVSSMERNIYSHAATAAQAALDGGTTLGTNRARSDIT
jgi:alkyl sulfatase BDS1-like metallo-beta-lactamase superfamily hydrolase